MFHHNHCLCQLAWISCSASIALRLDLTPDDRDRLLKLVNDGNTAPKLVRRARIVLLCADGLGTLAVARRLQTSQPTVRLWRERYRTRGVAGLLKGPADQPGQAPVPPAAGSSRSSRWRCIPGKAPVRPAWVQQVVR